MQEIHEPDTSARWRGAVLIEDWRPEDKAFWDATGRRSRGATLDFDPGAAALVRGVEVWSVVVAKLPSVGFKFTTDQLFWLAALPALSGATLRIFYSLHGADLRRAAAGPRSPPGRC